MVEFVSLFKGDLISESISTSHPQKDGRKSLFPKLFSLQVEVSDFTHFILRMGNQSDNKIPSEINSPLSSGLDNYFFSCNTLAVLVLVITGLLPITVSILGLLLGVSEQFSAEFLAEVSGSSDFRFQFTPVTKKWQTIQPK